jgi:hypothetical protein
MTTSVSIPTPDKIETKAMTTSVSIPTLKEAIKNKIDMVKYCQTISSNQQQSEINMTTVECEECSGMFAVEDTVTNQHYGEERHWCEDCYENNHTQCDCCEEFFFFEEMTDPMNCDHYYCEECAEREFGACEECEEACSSDAKYCPDCVENKEKKISISKNSNTKSQKIESLLLKEGIASKQQQDEQVNMELSAVVVCGDCKGWRKPSRVRPNDVVVQRSPTIPMMLCRCDWGKLSKNTEGGVVKKIEVQKENTDRSILQEEDEQVKMENTDEKLPTEFFEDLFGWDGGEPLVEDSGSDEEHGICEGCFGEMMEQMTEGGGYYQCPALSPYEIQKYTVEGINFCEKHYNEIVKNEKMSALQKEVVASGGEVIDASNMTREEIAKKTKEMEAKGFGAVEIVKKGLVDCVLKCGRRCEKRIDLVGLSHKDRADVTLPEGSWVCDVCYKEKGLDNIRDNVAFEVSDNVACFGCSYIIGDKRIGKWGTSCVPANLLKVLKPSKKNPDYYCNECRQGLEDASENMINNPGDEFWFVGRTEGRDDGMVPIAELRELNMETATNDEERISALASKADVARMKGMLEYNDVFLSNKEIVKAVYGYRFVVNKDERIREWKKGNEAEKAAAEVLANAAAFVEEKAEKPKTKKQIQAEATKAANQAVKDKKKAKEEYEKAVIECAKRQAENDRLKAEKKKRVKANKEKEAKKAAAAAVCVGCGSAEIAYTDCGGKKGVSMCQDCWT